MRCKACNRPIVGSNLKNGDLCSHCRSEIEKDLSDDGFANPEYIQSEVSLKPINIEFTKSDGADSHNIDSRKYFYDFFDNF